MQMVSPKEANLQLFVPSELDGGRLDHVLEALLADESRSRLQKWVRRGRVLIDGRRVLRSNVRVPGGSEIRIRPEDDPRPPVRIVYEDEHLAVIDKPAGLVVHPNDRVQGATLTDWLAARFGELPTVAGKSRPGIVHRLDRDTSGLMVVARTRSAHSALRTFFRERRIEKRYLAICHGEPRLDAFTIEHPVGPASDDPAEDRQRVHPTERAKDATTEVRLLERFDGFSRLECRPRTGRRHQIRVHLHAEGLPLVGDELYARPSVMSLPEGAPPMPRQALHALGLAFRHPATGEEVRFEAPQPPDMQALTAWLRAERGLTNAAPTRD